MPVAFLDTGIQTSAGRAGARSLVPGVEPGGSRAGQPTKPALLITEIECDLVSIGRAATADYDSMSVSLMLSQESDLTPGQDLHLATYNFSGPATANEGNFMRRDWLGDIHLGTIWAPAYAGVYTREIAGVLNAFQARIWLHYERVDIPWMDWFILWDYLDNVVDGSREY